ncbi:MAG: glycosyltransferase [Pirellulaceae bacterium]|nr:glycosyltransferase [Pirellulaceae bacterium]
MRRSVVFLVSQFPRLSETFVVGQAAGVVRRGHELRILVFSDRPKTIGKTHAAVEQYDLLGRTSYLGKLPRGSRQRMFGITRQLARHPGSWSLLCRSLVTPGHRPWPQGYLRATSIPDIGTPDIIHCQFGPLGLDALMLRDLLGWNAPLVCSFRGWDASSFIQRHGDRVYAELFRRGDFFLPNCEHFRGRIVGLGCDPGKTAVLASGIDCQLFSPSSGQRSGDPCLRLTTVGRLVEKKGIEFGLRMVATLVARGIPVRYRIVGEGELRPALQALIGQLKIAEHAQLLGEMNQTELLEVLRTTEVFVAPNVRARDGNEDAPINVLKEAMAMEIPVLASRHGGIVELVEDGVSGRLAREGDPDDLTAKMLQLLADRQQWPAMGRAGRRQVLEKFELETLNDQLLDYYEQAIAGYHAAKGRMRVA